MRGEDRHRQRRTDAVRADEHLERRALVAGGEPVERLAVLADVVVDVEEGGRRRLQLRQRPRATRRPGSRRRRPRAARCRRGPARGPRRAASRSPPGRPFAARAATRARIGADARWHSASAAASAASGGCGGLASRSRAWTIFCTCSFAAPPQPATASLTWFGVYWATSQPAAAASASASPLAWPTLIAVRTLTWKKTCSTATAPGRNSAISGGQLGAQARQALRQRVAVAGVRITPSATAVASPAPRPSMTAYPHRVRPGSMPSTRRRSSANTGSDLSQPATSGAGSGRWR